MAGEGRPPTTFLMAAAKVVGGLAKPGHDTQMTRRVNPFITWYNTSQPKD
jgi:hypothetical protein